MRQGNSDCPRDNSFPTRTPTRLQSFDYSREGAYFVTVCTSGRVCLFGEIVDGAMRPNLYGQKVLDTWHHLSGHYPFIQRSAFVLMPNHIHGVLAIEQMKALSVLGSTRSGYRGLPEVVRGFKTFSARAINEIRGTPGQHVWQRGFYDHIVRSEHSLTRILEYIANNPLQWTLDRENPDNWREGLKPSPCILRGVS